MKVEVIFQGGISVAPAYAGERFDPVEEQDQVLDMVMDHLLGQTSIEDPSVSGSVTTGDVSITLTVESDSPQDALRVASEAIDAWFTHAGVLLPVWRKVGAEDLVDA